jgi:hypothetical protein
MIATHDVLQKAHDRVHNAAQALDNPVQPPHKCLRLAEALERAKKVEWKAAESFQRTAESGKSLGDSGTGKVLALLPYETLHLPK